MSAGGRKHCMPNHVVSEATVMEWARIYDAWYPDLLDAERECLDRALANLREIGIGLSSGKFLLLSYLKHERLGMKHEEAQVFESAAL